MDEKVKACLYDILQSINEIESYFAGKKKSFEEYKSDIKTKRAVERDLEIIGEAVNRIRKIDSSIEINNAEKIVATRNRIIHGYDNVSDELIWAIIINHIEKLKVEVDTLLNK